MKDINVSIKIDAPEICSVIMHLVDVIAGKGGSNEGKPIQEDVRVKKEEAIVEKAFVKETVEEDEVVGPKEGISFEELKTLCAKARNAGVEVGAILKKYGTTKLSQVDPLKYESIKEEVLKEQAGLDNE